MIHTYKEFHMSPAIRTLIKMTNRKSVGRIIIGLILLITLIGALGQTFASAHALFQRDALQLQEEDDPSTAPARPPAQTEPQAPEADYQVHLPIVRVKPDDAWPMVAGNPERTSWVPQQVSGRNLDVLWYRPIEAYIPQNVQIIASNGLLFIASARGLYALDANSGDLAWRYDTELPIGNSPTVANGVVYFGGHDHKIHALDAVSGAHLWSYDGAEAGYATNPLVVNGAVYAGNRDGYMYAIGAHGSPNQGRLIWRYKTGGQINYSAAFAGGALYFASNDNHAYAINAATGSLIWKSELLPGDGFQSFWAVVYRDKVIFTTASRYRADRAGQPGVSPGDNALGIEDLFPNGQDGSTIGAAASNQAWASNNPVINAARILEYHENHQSDPAPQNPDLHKPWRRIMIVLNRSDGREYTFDTDQDGWRETIPFVAYGKDGSYYPPIVGSDGLLYAFNIYRAFQGYQGRVMGWNIDHPQYLSVLDSWDVLAEPMVISAGGNLIYRVTCCDRKGTYESILDNTNDGSLWEYQVETIMPGYDEMWQVAPDAISRHKGWYTGATDSTNGIYHYHGNDQNPLIPYDGKIFVRRSNAIVAFGTGPSIGKLPTVMINPVTDNVPVPSNTALSQRLESYVQQTIDAGFLRPAYITANVGNHNELDNYFQNPGETLYSLSVAYPYLSSGLQTQVRNYLQQYYQAYFSPVRYAVTGWAGLAARESMPLPDDAVGSIPNLGPRQAANQYTWAYPPHNIYSLYKYAENVSGVNIQQVYDTAKSILRVPANIPEENYLFDRYPYEHNAWIASYVGFLKLQDLARNASGNPGLDESLRQQVTTEQNRMLQLRYNLFDKDTPWVEDEYNYYKKLLDVARNFMYLMPDVGDYYRQNILSKVQEALDEYDYVAPYWFVTNFENAPGERGRQHLYNQPAMYQAMAYILDAPKSTLIKYLDAPKFGRGDLFYIQNLVAILEAP
jgi:hypothetical protein